MRSRKIEITDKTKTAATKAFNTLETDLLHDGWLLAVKFENEENGKYIIYCEFQKL